MAAGGGLVVIAVVVVVTVVVLRGDDDHGPAAPTAPPGARSSVAGTVTDPQAHLSMSGSAHRGPTPTASGSALAGRVTGRILAEHFAMNEKRTSLSSAARTVDGHQGWLERFRLDFTDAAAKGWRFRADTVAILLVDTGGRHLGELWVSVPDSFAHQDDVDQVLDSVRVS